MPLFKIKFASAILEVSVLVLGVALAARAQKSGEAAPAVLEIQVRRPIAKVSPTLYGLMTEEINHSYDGGLYAELVRNRALTEESWHPAGAWCRTRPLGRKWNWSSTMDRAQRSREA
jgi:alpha-N-arabinofuranosidase